MAVNRMPPAIGPQAGDGSKGSDVDGIVHVDVEGAPFRSAPVEARAQPIHLADIGSHRNRAPSHRLEAAAHVLSAATARYIVHRHIGTAGAQLERNRPSDTA